jgi:hypothetical protein
MKCSTRAPSRYTIAPWSPPSEALGSGNENNSGLLASKRTVCSYSRFPTSKSRLETTKSISARTDVTRSSEHRPGRGFLLFNPHDASNSRDEICPSPNDAEILFRQPGAALGSGRASHFAALRRDRTGGKAL